MERETIDLRAQLLQIFGAANDLDQPAQGARRSAASAVVPTLLPHLDSGTSSGPGQVVPAFSHNLMLKCLPLRVKEARWDKG